MVEIDKADIHNREESLALATQQRLLHATDWIEACDVPFVKVDWSEYREQLRKVSDQPGWPDKVNWPKPPRRS